MSDLPNSSSCSRRLSSGLLYVQIIFMNFILLWKFIFPSQTGLLRNLWTERGKGFRNTGVGFLLKMTDIQDRKDKEKK